MTGVGVRGPEPAPPPTSPAAPSCGCGGPLDLSQPDPHRPDRLLGVCSGCGQWYQLGATDGAPVPVPDLT